MLELLYTSAKTITSVYPGLGGMVYLGSWDALLLLNGGRLDKLFRDGSQAVIGVAPSYWGPVKSEDEAKKITDEVCKKLLSNPVMEDYEFEIT